MTWTAHLWELALALFACATFIYVRGHGGAAAMEQLERANRILGRRVEELERQNDEQGREIVALRAKTDVAEAFRPVSTALDLHEANAELRVVRILHVLDLIAERLGPDTVS